MLKTITTGSAIGIKGKFIRSAGGKQQVEVIAGDIEVYGIADPQEYPLQKKEHSLEYLREIAHLRYVQILLVQYFVYAIIWLLPYIVISMKEDSSISILL